jgi:regulator of protease activity HflC (stomatin/prohibitin superfamily)
MTLLLSLALQVILLMSPGILWAQSRAHLGVIIQNAPRSPEGTGQTPREGALILGLMRNSPAEVSGLRRGDIILKFNGQAVRQAEDLQRLVAAAQPDETIELEIARRGQTLVIPVKITAPSAASGGSSPETPLPFFLSEEGLWAVLVIAAVLLIAVYLSSARPWRGWPSERALRLLAESRRLRVSYIGVVSMAAFGLAVIFLWASLIIVPPGHRGAVFHLLSGVHAKPLGEGIHFLMPLLNRVTMYDIRSRVYHVQSLQAPPQRSPTPVPEQLLWTPTADGLKVGLDLTIRYRIDASRLGELHRHVGPQFEEKIVHPIVWNVTRLVASEYSLLDIYGKRRHELQHQAFSRVQSLLARDGLIGEDLLLRDVVYTKEFEKTLIAKMVAEQRVQESGFEVQQAALRAQVHVIEAQGEAEALELVNRAVRDQPLLLQYLWIKSLPEQVKVMVVPKGTAKAPLPPKPTLPETQRAHTADGEGG